MEENCMKCMEFFEKLEDAKEFIKTLTWKDANAELEEGYMPNDDIPYEEYKRTMENYHGWFVWFNPKPYRR